MTTSFIIGQVQNVLGNLLQNNISQIILMVVRYGCARYGLFSARPISGRYRIKAVFFQRVKNPSTAKIMLHNIYAYAGSRGGTAQ